MSPVLFFFIFSLSALVRSINVNGLTACEDTYNKQQMESYEESQRQMGRIGLECETYTSSTSGSNSTSAGYVILDFFLLFSIVGVSIGVCIVCIRRQKAINAANLGQVGAAQVAHGTDLKSYPETNTVQKGEPNDYKV